MKDGEALKLTRDGRSKVQAVLSPSNGRIAYAEECPQNENCTPSVVILDLAGRRLKSFQAMIPGIQPASPCRSILDIAWLTETRISVECHVNPSISEYLETDLTSGKTVRDLRGLSFTPSPNRKYVAHVGPIVHFAPPVNQSYYLYIDNVVVYPLPSGMKPTETQPNVVNKRRCFVAAVARSGQSSLFPIADASAVDANAVSFTWESPHELSAQIGGISRRFSLP